MSLRARGRIRQALPERTARPGRPIPRVELPGGSSLLYNPTAGPRRGAIIQDDEYNGVSFGCFHAEYPLI
jgi:hypothetical protein